MCIISHYFSCKCKLILVVTDWGSLNDRITGLWGLCSWIPCPRFCDRWPQWLQSTHPPPALASAMQAADSLTPAWMEFFLISSA